MGKFLFLYFLLFPFFVVIAQEKNEDEINSAFQNAKKGIYWALSNIPDSKHRLNHKLISENKLIASVKLEVEVNGIKVSSQGFNSSTEVSIKIYKSIESLQKEGYLKSRKIKPPADE